MNILLIQETSLNFQGRLQWQRRKDRNTHTTHFCCETFFAKHVVLFKKTIKSLKDAISFHLSIRIESSRPGVPCDHATLKYFPLAAVIRFTVIMPSIVRVLLINLVRLDICIWNSLRLGDKCRFISQLLTCNTEAYAINQHKGVGGVFPSTLKR